MRRLVPTLLASCMFFGMAFFPCITPAQAAKAKITVTFANGMSPNHVVNIAYQKFVKNLEERSNGEMTGVVFPNNQLGSDTVAMQAILDHTLVMTWTATSAVTSFVPDAALFDIPFFFSSLDLANKALADKRLMDPIQKRYEKVGFYNLGMDAQGFRWMTSKANRRINSLDDMKGFKIRAVENPIHVAFWRALGAAPTPLANSERYTALQQGTVDGQENVIENAFNTKIYEVQDIFYNTRHMVYIGIFVGDLQWIKALSPEHRKIFMETMDEFRKDTVAMSMVREQELLAELETKYKKTVVREMPAGEFERWQKAARPAAEKIVRDKLGDELVDLMYEVTGQTK